MVKSQYFILSLYNISINFNIAKIIVQYLLSYQYLQAHLTISILTSIFLNGFCNIGFFFQYFHMFSGISISKFHLPIVDIGWVAIFFMLCTETVSISIFPNKILIIGITLNIVWLCQKYYFLLQYFQKSLQCLFLFKYDTGEKFFTC